MKAVIFDCNDDRRAALCKAIEDAKWDEGANNKEVFNTESEEDPAPLHDPSGFDLVMLHLRVLHSSENGGNFRSWEILTKLDAMPVKTQPCLIAYTGGNIPAPDEFAQFQVKGYPWVYMTGIKGPDDIHLKEFAEAWIKDPAGKPPLDIVCPPLQQVEVNTQITALKFLILGYQSAHPCCIGNDTSCHGNDNSTEALHTWTESPDCWLPVLGENTSGAQALIKASDNHDLKNLVSKLAEFFNSPDQTHVFPHAALCAFSSGIKSAA